REEWQASDGGLRPFVLEMPSRHRYVHSLGVLFYHTARAELRRHRPDRFFDDSKPAFWHAVFVAIVEGRDDLFLEQAVQGLRIRRVDGGVVRCDAAVDEPSVGPGVALRPPTVAHAKVDDAVDGSLDPARPAGFKRFAGIVQPDVASLNEEVRHVEVVIVQNDEAPAE